jgi:hypothetical protein
MRYNNYYQLREIVLIKILKIFMPPVEKVMEYILSNMKIHTPLFLSVQGNCTDYQPGIFVSAATFKAEQG